MKNLDEQNLHWIWIQLVTLHTSFVQFSGYYPSLIRFPMHTQQRWSTLSYLKNEHLAHLFDCLGWSVPYCSGLNIVTKFFLGAYYRSSTCIYAGQSINWLSSNNIKSHIIGYIKHSPLCSRAGGNLNEFVQIITRSFNPELIWTYYNKTQ